MHESDPFVDVKIDSVSVIITAITGFSESTRDGQHETDREESMFSNSIPLAEDIAG
jgi:hypothetical protein